MCNCRIICYILLLFIMKQLSVPNLVFFIRIFLVCLIENTYMLQLALDVGKTGLLEQHLNKRNSADLLREINYERKIMDYSSR